ncbi:MAG TPA: SH3 domain-containing protein [Aggregatilinea sp.]|jgi:hypothetical protein|uniref:SH3 domain-containing protein n=1 Tax=Aggregatilinea sp. TaxID=2806333 RepID=UPI002C794E68|nr:SH3 domain-containing protein [Aggregatilinea sp.]HML22695.1 SH3 domain-containing protein [Aggregatilinea sp.]
MDNYARLYIYRLFLIVFGILVILVAVFIGSVFEDGSFFVVCGVGLPLVLLGVLALAVAELLTSVMTYGESLNENHRASDRQLKQILTQLQSLTLAVSPYTAAQPAPETDDMPRRAAQAEAAPDSNEPDPAPAGALAGRVSAERAMLRKSPSTTGAIARIALHDQVLDVTGRSADGLWLRVLVGEERDVWVEASDVEVKGNINALPIIP